MEFCGPHIFWNITSSAFPHLAMYRLFGFWAHDDLLHHRISSGASGAGGMWPTDASGPTDYSVMKFRHWPESVCSHWISPATRFPPPSETTILQYPELSHWLGRTTGPWRLESKAITYMERIRSLLTYVAPVPRVLAQSATSANAMEESFVYEGFLYFLTRHFLEKAYKISWDEESPSKGELVAADQLNKRSRSRVKHADEPGSHSVANEQTSDICADVISSPVLSADYYTAHEDRSTPTASCSGEDESGPEDPRRSQGKIRARRSDAAFKFSVSTVGHVGIRSHSHRGIFSGRDLSFDSRLRVFHRTLDNSELALCDPLARCSVDNHEEDVLAQEVAATQASTSSVDAKSNSQERKDQDTPSKSSRQPSFIRLLSLSDTMLGRLTRRRKLSSASSADGAPAPPAKRRRTTSGNLFVRSAYKARDRIRKASLN